MNYRYCIVIVTYNRVELLKECMEHAINQTVPAKKIIVVNNNSTDGTKEYLIQFEEKERFIIANEKKNIGGAGGFAKGIQLAYEEDIDWIMLIDDDAILNYDCMEKMNPFTAKNKARAYGCTVLLDGGIDVSHRRNLNSEIGLDIYKFAEFSCELATFCGLMFDKRLIDQIGLPDRRYYIWFDDSEYCLRINKYSKIIVRSDAKLNHKVKVIQNNSQQCSLFHWKEYYGVRNSIYTYKKHRYYKECWKAIKKTIKQIIKCYFYAKKDRKYILKAKMLRTALNDAIFGRLGENVDYPPGTKN